MLNWFSECFGCEPGETSRTKQLETSLANFIGWLQKNGSDHDVLCINPTLDGYGRVCVVVRLHKRPVQLA